MQLLDVHNISTTSSSLTSIPNQAVDPSSETKVVSGLFTQAECLGTIDESALDTGDHCDEILGLAVFMKIKLLIPEGTTSASWAKQSDKQYPKTNLPTMPRAIATVVRRAKH